MRQWLARMTGRVDELVKSIRTIDDEVVGIDALDGLDHGRGPGLRWISTRVSAESSARSGSDKPVVANVPWTTTDQ